jgi:hypothetical protein
MMLSKGREQDKARQGKGSRNPWTLTLSEDGDFSPNPKSQGRGKDLEFHRWDASSSLRIPSCWWWRVAKLDETSIGSLSMQWALYSRPRVSSSSSSLSAFLLLTHMSSQSGPPSPWRSKSIILVWVFGRSHTLLFLCFFCFFVFFVFFWLTKFPVACMKFLFAFWEWKEE